MSVRRESAGEMNLSDSSWSCPGSSKDSPSPQLDSSCGVIISTYRSLLLQLKHLESAGNRQEQREQRGETALSC